MNENLLEELAKLVEIFCVLSDEKLLALVAYSESLSTLMKGVDAMQEKGEQLINHEPEEILEMAHKIEEAGNILVEVASML